MRTANSKLMMVKKLQEQIYTPILYIVTKK